MTWTKRQFVEQAFEEIGLAAYIFDLTADQLTRALYKMDAMIAGWNANGIRIAYPLPSSPDSADLDQETGVPDFANEAIYLNLAIRLAPAFGKAVAAETRMAADLAYSNMANQATIPTPERQLPQTMARGQGNKPWRNTNNPYLNRPEDPLLSGSDGPIEFS